MLSLPPCDIGGPSRAGHLIADQHRWQNQDTEFGINAASLICPPLSVLEPYISRVRGHAQDRNSAFVFANLSSLRQGYQLVEAKATNRADTVDVRCWHFSDLSRQLQHGRFQC